MHVSRLSTIWRRWCNTGIGRRGFPNGKMNAGGLLMNSRQDSVRKTLWKYFNAPGNLMFVTCNLVTFAGFVTINSMVNSNCERLAEAKLSEAESSLEVEEVRNDEKESPLTEYTANNFWCPAKTPPLATYNSQMAKMSLFHMLYAFYLYKDVLIADQNRQMVLPKEWQQEVEYLQDSEKDTFACTYREMDKFYNEWKQEFLQVFADLNKSQRFTLPTWKNYPKPLRIICDKLYHNDMENILNFADLYNEIPSIGIKRLLRRWLLDYTHLVSTTGPTAENEKFYRQLLKDSQGDEVIFNNFASLILNPSDPRRTCFLPKLNQIHSASIDTALLVLRGYVHLREKMNKNHNGPIIRLLSMLKKDCVVGPGDQPRSNTVRILLPTDAQRDSLEQVMTPQKRQKSLALVSHHSEAIKLLDSISKWNRPT